MPFKDPEKAKTYAKKHYENNKADYKARARKFTKKNRKVLRDWVWEYFSTHHCVDCKENNPIVLQFDHLRDKKYNVGNMLNHGLSLETLKAEVAKCEVRCANCHMKKTALERGWWADKLA